MVKAIYLREGKQTELLQLMSKAKNEITIHKVSAHCMVHFEHGAGYLWNGEPLYCSWYA